MKGRAYVTDISLAGIPARAPSMLLDTIRVGPNTYMGVSRACDEAMAAPSSVSRALLDPFLRGVTFLAIEGLDEILANKANQQCHFKTSRCCTELLAAGSSAANRPYEKVRLGIRRPFRFYTFLYTYYSSILSKVAIF